MCESVKAILRLIFETFQYDIPVRVTSFALWVDIAILWMVIALLCDCKVSEVFKMKDPRYDEYARRIP